MRLELVKQQPQAKSEILWLYQYWGSLEISPFALPCITLCCIFLPIKEDEFKGTGESEKTVNADMFD